MNFREMTATYRELTQEEKNERIPFIARARSIQFMHDRLSNTPYYDPTSKDELLYAFANTHATHYLNQLVDLDTKSGDMGYVYSNPDEAILTLSMEMAEYNEHVIDEKYRITEEDLFVTWYLFQILYYDVQRN